MNKKSLGLIIALVIFTLLTNPSQAILDLQVNKVKANVERVKAMLQGDYVTDEILVQFKNSQRFQRIKVPSSEMAQRLAQYLEQENVIYAEPNYKTQALMVPNDTYYDFQWHLDNSDYHGLNLEKAWDISQGQGVVVAVIDTGIAYENYCTGSGWYQTCFKQAPDLADTCFVQGYDFYNDDSHPNDDSSPGHGTHLAGTIAQSTNNHYGVAGVAFKACLMPVKVLSSSGGGTYADLADGIYYAADHGANIINISSGGSADAATLKDAVAYAYDHGVTIVAGAGNDGSSRKVYPAGYDDYVIAVGATQYDQQLAPYSNYGSYVDLVAPGGNSNLDQNHDGYGDGVLQQSQKISSYNQVSFGYYFFQGTSMSAPHVAGVAALIIANGNATTPDQVREVLQTTAEDLGSAGYDTTYGWGLVDAFAALQGSAAPAIACYSNADCDDQNECTADTCLNPGTAQASCQNSPKANNTTCSQGICCQGSCLTPTCNSDSQCNSNQECRQGSCQNPNTCSATCSYSNQPDNTPCSAGVCCSGTCQTPLCLQDNDCDDHNACTLDTCSLVNTCQAQCQHQAITSCLDNDGCCPAGCSYLNDNDCSASVTEDSLHVADISFSSNIWNFGLMGTYCRVTAQVMVNDDQNQPVRSARVYATWSGAYNRSVSSKTNSQGLASFSTSFIRGCGNFTLTITDLVKDDYVYDSSSNTETTDSISLP